MESKKIKQISTRMSNLNGMEKYEAKCSLVHDAVVSGDIQIVLCCIASTRMKRRRKEKKKEKKIITLILININ